MDKNHKKLNKFVDPNSSYFLGYFLRKKFGRNWWGWSEIRGNQGLLIPLDVDVTTFVGPIFTNSRWICGGSGDEGYKLTHTHTNQLSP